MRNLLRIAGIHKEEGKEKNNIVLGLAATLNIELNQADIDSSRCVGKPVTNGPAVM